MKILVTGATGNVGSQLVKQLAQSGHDVRALTRSPAKANFPEGVEVVAGDLAKPETLVKAFEGVNAVHLINFGGDDFALLQTGAEIVAMAEQAGVERVTVLRGGAVGTIEQALEASSLAWTFLQPVEFMSNTLKWAESIRSKGEVRLPFGSRKSAIVHEADIAAVAAVALTQDGHAGKIYSITGCDVLTPRDMVGRIGAAIGEDIRFVELSEVEAREQWTAEGLPSPIIEFLLWVYGNTPPAGYTVVHTVEQVTGHAPRTFAQWAAEHADAFRAPVPERVA